MKRPFTHIALAGEVVGFEAAPREVSGLCDEAQFLLRLVAAYHGFQPEDMLNRLVAREAQAIGIATLDETRRMLAVRKPELTLLRGGAPERADRQQVTRGPVRPHSAETPSLSSSPPGSSLTGTQGKKS